jgi:hypothetical protein
MRSSIGPGSCAITSADRADTRGVLIRAKPLGISCTSKERDFFLNHFMMFNFASLMVVDRPQSAMSMLLEWWSGPRVWIIHSQH